MKQNLTFDKLNIMSRVESTDRLQLVINVVEVSDEAHDSESLVESFNVQ